MNIIVYQNFFHKFMVSSYTQLIPIELNYRTYQHKNCRLTSVASKYVAILNWLAFLLLAKSIAAVFSYVKILLGTADFNHVLLCDCALYTLRQFIKYEMDCAKIHLQQSCTSKHRTGNRLGVSALSNIAILQHILWTFYGHATWKVYLQNWLIDFLILIM